MYSKFRLRSKLMNKLKLSVSLEISGIEFQRFAAVYRHDLSPYVVV